MSADTDIRTTGLPHAVFLQRMTAEDDVPTVEVRLGQGAFLVLRFVDLLAPDREPPAPDVFRYQWTATERYCAELASEGGATEAAHLSGIVSATGEAHRLGDVRLMPPALLAYALYLEQEGHLEEAEDVLLTLIRVGGERLASKDTISTWLRLGRVRRMQADFDGAIAAYAEAGRLAAASGDHESLLVSRGGHCNVLYFLGNLADAERNWRAVLAEASVSGFCAIQAHAEHGLGTVLQRRGQPQAAAAHLWRAYELHQDEANRMRALGDLGALLLTLGDVEEAERALLQVVRSSKVVEPVVNAKIELMHSASLRRDRVGFERWRDACLAHADQMLPNVRADYYLKTGIGLARFGSYRRAEENLCQGLEVALAHGLHELVFRIERIKAGLHDCEALAQVESGAIEPVQRDEVLREVYASLAALSD